jgi:hypothetical protein
MESESQAEMKVKLEDALQKLENLHKAQIAPEPEVAPEKETKRGKKVNKEMEAWKA